MKSPSGPLRVVVIGGGISGLAAAYRLVREGERTGLNLSVRVLEAGPRSGGAIGTRVENGSLLEEGPDCFLSTKPWALNLIRELGIEDQLIGISPQHPRSFLSRGGRLLPIPHGFHFLAPASLWPAVKTPIFSWRGKLRMAMEPFIQPRKDTADETLESFVVRRLGREALDRLAQPMVAGIYSADPGRLSMKATFPQFLQWEQQHGSILKALHQLKRKRKSTDRASGARSSVFLSLCKGLQSLVDALVSSMPEGTIRLNSKVTKVMRGGDGRWRIVLQHGAVEAADALCLALPAPKAAEILVTASVPLAHALEGISYRNLITVNLALPRSAVEHPLDGMGFFIPAIENRTVLACTFSSIKFFGRAPDSQALLRAFLGGARHEELLRCSDREIERMVLDDLGPLMGLRCRPEQIYVHRHPGIMPQYHVGHTDRVTEIESAVAEIPGLALAGNAYHGVGIPDCIHSAEQAASNIMRFFGSQRGGESPSTIRPSTIHRFSPVTIKPSTDVI